MRRSIAVLVVLALFVPNLFACSRPEPKPDEPGPGGGKEWKVELPQSDKLASTELKTTEDGPWTVRRAARSSSAGSATRGARESLSGGEVAKGAAPPPVPGAKVDSPMDAPPTGGPGGAPEAESHDEVAMDPAAGPMPSMDSGGDKATPGSRPNTTGGAPLKAGATDDNEKFDEFSEYLAGWLGNQSVAASWDPLDVRDRTFVRVINDAGRPVPAARVTVVDETADAVLLRGTTYGDGRVPYYPRVASTKATAPDLLVEVAHGDVRERVRWDGKTELSVTLAVAEPVLEPVLLDVLFVIDTTGSMGDEIERVKQSLLGVTAKLRSLSREFDLRYSAVLYRDIGDAYVTKSHPFTGDIEAFDKALQTIRAAGGGDGPESLNQGLAEAVGRDDWREGAAKVMFLIADAPPHMDYEGDIFYGESLKAAVGKGIRIHSVAASGLGGVGSLVFRQVAQFTRGKFIFIEYGGNVAASGAAHGVAGAKKSNNLDDILFEQIRDEVARWGR